MLRSVEHLTLFDSTPGCTTLGRPVFLSPQRYLMWPLLYRVAECREALLGREAQ